MKPLCRLGNASLRADVSQKEPSFRTNGAFVQSKMNQPPTRALGLVSRVQPGSKPLYRLNLALCPGRKVHHCAQCSCKNVARPPQHGSVVCLERRTRGAGSLGLTTQQRAMKPQGSIHFEFSLCYVSWDHEGLASRGPFPYPTAYEPPRCYDPKRIRDPNTD